MLQAEECEVTAPHPVVPEATIDRSDEGVSGFLKVFHGMPVLGADAAPHFFFEELRSHVGKA